MFLYLIVFIIIFFYMQDTVNKQRLKMILLQIRTVSLATGFTLTFFCMLRVCLSQQYGSSAYHINSMPPPGITRCCILGKDT